MSKFTAEDMATLANEIKTKDLVLRHWSGVEVPDAGGVVVGPVYGADATFKVGDVVSAPILKTAQFGPALHGKATIVANAVPGHPEFRVQGSHCDYAIIADRGLNIWRPAIRGWDIP
jgi:hypothetical protein